MAHIALSHSRLSDYQQCPLKFRLKYLDKAFPVEKKEDSPHLVRGDNVHKALEKYVVKKLSGETNIPASSLAEVERTKPLIDTYFQTFDEVHPEIQLATTGTYQKCEWFDKNTSWRAIIDCLCMGYANEQRVALASDWKTGQIRDYDGWGGQLHLTSTLLLKVFPDLWQVTSVYVYVDHKQKFPIVVTQDDVPKLVDHYNSEFERVNTDKEFAPKVNEFCKYCPATKAQCPYSRKL